MRGRLTNSLLAIARRPDLWPTAFNEWRALTSDNWWRRWPPVPGPSPEYLAFRMQTMYGVARTMVEPEDLVRYLEWCRWMRVRAR